VSEGSLIPNPWYRIQLTDVVSQLGTDTEKGLSTNEVKLKRQKYGPNILPDVEQRSTIQILFLQFKNLPILLLLSASILSYFIGRVPEAIAIFAVVFMTIGFGFFMEKSAERAISSLVSLRAPKAKVLRNAQEKEINAHDLVPGDIIEFEAGDKIPADCRLVEAFDLVADESPLTGESQGARKDSEAIAITTIGSSGGAPEEGVEEVELAERKNMCYMGTLALEGRAKAVVVTTGRQTEIGKVGELLQGVSGGKTPLERKIEQLGKTLVIAVFAITGIYIGIGYLQGFDIGSIILSGIVLAIAAVPEGLPAIATITLAFGVKRMAKKHALVRRLASAETLGSVTVVCTDKTGTLTKNEPTLREIVLWNGNNTSSNTNTSTSISNSNSNSITEVLVTGEGFDPTKGAFYYHTSSAKTNTTSDTPNTSLSSSQDSFTLSKNEEKEKDRLTANPIQNSDLLMFLKAGSLCNNAELLFDEESKNDKTQISHQIGADSGHWTIQGDTTEGALVVAAHKAGLEKQKLEEQYDRLWEDPFDSKTRRMVTVHRTNSNKDGNRDIIAFLKGAPEAILPICNRVRENGRIVELNSEKLKEIEARIESLTAKSYRLLLIAYKVFVDGQQENDEQTQKVESLTKGAQEVENENEYYLSNAAKDCIFLGIAGIYDPPRPEAKDAIKFMKDAKTRVIMITGDHPTTARAVAAELEIGNSDNDGNNITVLSGSDLGKMSVERLAETIDNVDVFARATPEHKLKIVEALQRKGHVVAMTGDGVNDAPALKQADIGVAMGKRGTDVTKESAELILLDDNFATITHAVDLGRLIYSNIKKFVRYLFSCNISEVMTMLVAIIFALPFPLLPLQLLWMNLTINTFPALALAVEKGKTNGNTSSHNSSSKEGSFSSSLSSSSSSLASKSIRPPRKNESMISKKEWLDISIQSGFMAAAAIGVFVWALSQQFEHEEFVAETMSFTTLSLAQAWHVLNYSSTLKSIFKRSKRTINSAGEINKPLIGAIALSLGLLLLVIYVNPLNEIFELHPLNLYEWGIVSLASILSVIAISVSMHIFRRITTK
jgi:P-type Ca2+ transporter type 2C